MRSIQIAPAKWQLALLLVAGCLAASSLAADTTAPASAAASSIGCQGETATSAHDRIIQLSKLIDPSGRLSKMIADFHPAHADHQHGGGAPADPMQVAASEIDQVKREVDPATGGSNATVSEPTTTTSAPTAASTSLAALSSTTAAPVATTKSAGLNNTATVAPPVKPTEASNVTVNVFLQLVPDAKTEELINNPDVAVSSTAAPSVSSSSPAPQVDSNSNTNITQAAPSSSTTVASVMTTMVSSTPAPAVSSTTVTSSTAPSEAPVAIKPTASRRRRRWAKVMTATEAASSSTAAPVSEAPRQKVSTLASTSTQATTSTTTTNTPAPVTRAASTLATTSSTTTTAAPTSSTTTTTGAPKSTTTSTSTTTAAPTPAASTTSTQATVELSAKDLAVAASGEQMTGETLIEIVVSAVPQAASAPSPPVAAPQAPTTTTKTTSDAPKPSSMTATTTTTTTPTTTTLTPTTSTTTTTTTPAPTSTTTAAPTKAAPAAPVKPAAAPVAPQQSDRAPPMAAAASQSKAAEQAAGMHSDIVGGGGNGGVGGVGGAEATPNERSVAKQSTARLGNEVKRDAQAQDGSGAGSTSYQADRASELALGSLNLIYDSDGDQIGLTSTGSSQPIPADHSSEERGDLAGKQQLGDKSLGASSFVHGEHGDDLQEPQDNYATCLLESPVDDGERQVANLTGRLNFWQPIQNRGVLHLIACLRYSNARASGELARGSRLRRESFQALIERAPPVTSRPASNVPAESEAGPARQVLRHHQVWVLDDCGPLSLMESSGGDARRRLLAELKSSDSVGTIDIDAELTVGQFNLTHPNSIIGRCVQVSFRAADSPLETLVGSCKVQQSDDLPPVSELDHLPSVSVVQPIREDLLFASSPTPPSTTPSLSSSSSSTLESPRSHHRPI